MTTEKLNTKWVSPVITLSYPYLAEPASEEYGGKYSVSIPLPKSETEAVDELWEVIRNAAENSWTKKARNLKGIKTFVVDYDEEVGGDDEVYAGCLKFSAKSKRRPGCVYPNMRTIEVDDIEDVLYPGAKVRVALRAYATETGGRKTVAFGLGNVLFVEDGEKIGGGSKPEDDFDTYRDDSFDRFGTQETEDEFLSA